LYFSHSGKLIITLTIQIFNRNTVQATAVVPVASYESSSGMFDTVELAASNYSGSECDVLSSPTAQTSSSTLSVAVDVSRDTSQPGCEVSGGLSTGAIIGIAVGATVRFFLFIFLFI
jgi:hypothetical protein